MAAHRLAVASPLQRTDATRDPFEWAPWVPDMISSGVQSQEIVALLSTVELKTPTQCADASLAVTINSGMHAC